MFAGDTLHMNQDKYVFAKLVAFLDRNHFNYLVHNIRETVMFYKQRSKDLYSRVSQHYNAFV